MQRAVLLLDDARDPGRRVLAGEVGGDHGRAAKLTRERDQAVLTARDQHQLQIGFTRQPPRGRLTDPARGSRDQRHERHWSTAAVAIRRPSISALLPARRGGCSRVFGGPRQPVTDAEQRDQPAYDRERPTDAHRQPERRDRGIDERRVELRAVRGRS